MDAALAVILGIGLAASCGFRIFAPMLVVSAATNAGYLDVAQSFEWLGSTPAFIAFAVAAIVEIGAFYIPWLDNALDAIASPFAAVAGAMLFAAVAFELDPLMKWTLAIIAGGGSAALVQGGTVLTRLASTSTTAGLANFIISTIENLAGFAFPVLAIAVPIAALVTLAILTGAMYMIGRSILRRIVPASRGQNA